MKPTAYDTSRFPEFRLEFSGIHLNSVEFSGIQRWRRCTDLKSVDFRVVGSNSNFVLGEKVESRDGIVPRAPALLVGAGFKFRDKERTPASTRKDSLWLRVVSAMQQVQCLMFTVDYR